MDSELEHDRYGLPLSTSSAAARAAYVEAADLMLAMQDGAAAAFARATDADPGFALAQAGLARARLLGGDTAGAREAIAVAQEAEADAREASHVAVVATLLSRPADALAAVRAHVARWPRDALVAGLAANQTGLMGMSGLPRREQLQLEYLAALAPHYGDDWWFNAHYAMALSELGHQDEARPLIHRAMVANPRNGAGAHAFAHFLYETGEQQEAIAWLRRFLSDYRGALRGHLAWHLALVLLAEGDVESGFRLYAEDFAAEPYGAAAMIRLMDAASFLWRAELAGHPRDTAKWQALHDWAHRTFPQPGVAYVDWHLALVDSTIAPADADTRTAAIEALVAEGRYPPGPALPAAARGFAAFRRGEYAAAIAAIAPMLGERERLSGSRAQLDLLEFTLLAACVADGRTEEARRLLAARRLGPLGIPVIGAAALH
jgi:tetratricopeptide (TPR) repeat protein